MYICVGANVYGSRCYVCVYVYICICVYSVLVTTTPSLSPEQRLGEIERYCKNYKVLQNTGIYGGQYNH